MTIIHTANKEEMSRVAADILAKQITQNPQSVLGLATGGTPLGVYKILSAMYAAGTLDFSAVKTINLDE